MHCESSCLCLTCLGTDFYLCRGGWGWKKDRGSKGYFKLARRGAIIFFFCYKDRGGRSRRLLPFILNCNAWKLKTVAASSTITDFHHADTHFAKNLFTFRAFSNRRIFLGRSRYWVRSFRLLPSSMLTWEPCGCRPLLNWRKSKARTKIKTIASIQRKIWVHERRRLCMVLLNAFIVDKFLKKIGWSFRKSHLETRFWKLETRASKLDTRFPKSSSFESRWSTYLWPVLSYKLNYVLILFHTAVSLLCQIICQPWVCCISCEKETCGICKPDEWNAESVAPFKSGNDVTVETKQYTLFLTPGLRLVISLLPVASLQ